MDADAGISAVAAALTATAADTAAIDTAGTNIGLYLLIQGPEWLRCRTWRAATAILIASHYGTANVVSGGRNYPSVGGHRRLEDLRVDRERSFADQ